jgi:outer membrane protein OmpA-like peptidoglycan-associated protein
MRRDKFPVSGTVIALLALSMALILGCAAGTQVVLLPDPDGRVGTLSVTTERGAQTLDQAWQATTSAGMDKMPDAPKILKETEVRQTFREALAAEPIPPISFIIHFGTDSFALSAEADAIITQVIEAIQVRKSTDIVISGHTDAVGSVDYNRRLSLRRAKAVEDILIAKGIDGQKIHVTYHGKGNPVVQTPDGVPEPRNRRVEITIR